MEKSSDAFRTISEVADDLDLPQHVLRFWETRFSHIRPLKRAGGRRYYRPADVVLLRAIRTLLYDQGYTIKGVQRLLKEHGPRGLASDAIPLPVDLASAAQLPGALSEGTDDDLTETVGDDQGHSTSDLSPSHLAAGDQDALLEMLALIEECTRILEIARRPSA